MAVPTGQTAIATNGIGSHREAMLETRGQILEFAGAAENLHRSSLGASKERSANRPIGVHTGSVRRLQRRTLLGKHTAYVERTHLTSRQMNRRLMRKSLSYCKPLKLLRTACGWEDEDNSVARRVKTFGIECATGYGQGHWQAWNLTMVARLIDHI